MPIVGRRYLLRGEPVTVEIQWGAGRRVVRNVGVRFDDGRFTVRPFRGLRRLDDEHGVPLGVFVVDPIDDTELILRAARDDVAGVPVVPLEFDGAEGFSVAGDEHVVRHEAGGYR